MNARLRYTIVGTYDLDPIPVPEHSGDAFHFRVELLKDHDSGMFTFRLLRWEYYRLTPALLGTTIEGAEALTSMERVLVEDSVIVEAPGQQLFQVAPDALEEAVHKIIAKFSEGASSPGDDPGAVGHGPGDEHGL